MATTAQNNLVYTPGGNPRGLRWPVDSSGNHDVNQGDMVYLSSGTSYLLNPCASDANAANLYGVAGETSYINPYGLKTYFPTIVVFFGSVFFFNTTSGDTYNNGVAIYNAGVDAQTITNASGSNPIGYAYLNTPGTIGTAPTVAGGSNVTLPVFIVAVKPTTLA